MAKQVTTAIPDDAYEAIINELAVTRTQNLFLSESLDLLKAREEEATYVANSNNFMEGYRMAIRDLNRRVFNKDIQPTAPGEIQPWESDSPF